MFACGNTDVDEPGREPSAGVREHSLPLCVRDVLEAVRAARPESEVTCLAFRTLEGGRETMRMGPGADVIGDRNPCAASSRLHAKDLLVLSVTVTETTFATVRTVTHVLVARTELRARRH